MHWQGFEKGSRGTVSVRGDRFHCSKILTALRFVNKLQSHYCAGIVVCRIYWCLPVAIYADCAASLHLGRHPEQI